MSFGLQVLTSGGLENTIDIRTVVAKGFVTGSFPPNSEFGDFIYVNYPPGWIPESQSPNSFYQYTTIYSKLFPVDSDDPNGPMANIYDTFPPSAFKMEEVSGSRFKVTITTDPVADTDISVNIYCFQRGV